MADPVEAAPYPQADEPHAIDGRLVVGGALALGATFAIGSAVGALIG